MAPETWAEAPDLGYFSEVAEATRQAFPSPFDTLSQEVRLVVEEWPSDEVLDEMDIDNAYELSGLYEGAPLTERSVEWPEPPSVVRLYRRPILDEWAARGDVTLRDLVAHVTVHEFAHHFGWSDEQIAQIDRWWE